MKIARVDANHPDGSHLERTFDTLWRQVGGPDLAKQVPIVQYRRFRFDRAHITARVAIELDGGTWGVGGQPCECCGQRQLGGHSTGTGRRRDCEKGNLAALRGWTVFRLTTDMLENDPWRDLTLIRDFILGRLEG